ncbi:hypothetical protein PAAL109150_13830 [Paenibacillus alkaliterrae]
MLSLYALIQQIGPERLAALSNQVLKSAGEDFFKNEYEQALFSLRYLGFVEHESANRKHRCHFSCYSRFHQTLTGSTASGDNAFV